MSNPENDGSTSSDGKPAAGAGAGGAAPGQDFKGFTREYGGTGGDGKAGADGDGAAADPIVGELLGGLAGTPFDLLALKTGHRHWELKPGQRELLGRAAANVSSRYVGKLDPDENPLGVLFLGYIALAIPRVVEELALLRRAVEKDSAKNAG